jgi:hypothetical protein
MELLIRSLFQPPTSFYSLDGNILNTYYDHFYSV